MIEIKFVKTHPDAILPKRNHDNRPLTDKELKDIEKNRKDAIKQAAKHNMQIPELCIKTVDGTCDSGFDIFACEDTVIPSRDKATVPVGIKVGFITPGFWFKVESRSGLSFKSGVLAHPGIIDNQYRGDMGVCLYNHSEKAHTVKKGDRIAQIVIYQLWDVKVGWAVEAEETERGEKGFGSSDKKE